MANVETVEVPVTRSADGSIDLDAFRTSAEKVGKEYRENDLTETRAVATSVETILNDPKYAAEKNFTASVLAKMALGFMGGLPTDQRCAAAETRIKHLLSAQKDKFICVSRGRLAGYWLRDRLDKEDLEKLTKNNV